MEKDSDLDKTTEKFNKEFKNLSEKERIKVLDLDPKLVPKAELFLKYIQEKKHIETLINKSTSEPLNPFEVPLERAPLSYSEKNTDDFLREKDGTMMINRKIGDLQKKAVKTVLGQIVKKILSADLTGLNLPIFFFMSKTYLHTYALLFFYLYGVFF